MRVRYNKNSKEELRNFDRYIQIENIQNILKENKNKKVFLEIGMGKGQFISTLASLDHDNIYIGVELVESILALGIKKIKRFEQKNNLKLDNLYVMSFDAINLSDIFKLKQIDKIFLNFSDPWPKKRHIKRRLTYEAFLSEYKKVLKNDGTIEFKTDNRKLFEFSLISMQRYNMQFLEVFLDLHKEEIFNISTEYEEKFSNKGPIYKLVAKF